NKHHRISSPEDFITFVTSNKMPEKDEVVSVFCSTKNEPLHVSRFNTNDPSQFKNVLKESLDAGSVSMFYLSNYANTSNIYMKITNYFNTFDINVSDGLWYDEMEKTITSDQENYPYPVKDDMLKIDNVAEKDFTSPYHHRVRLISLEGFEAFTS